MPFKKNSLTTILAVSALCSTWNNVYVAAFEAPVGRRVALQKTFATGVAPFIASSTPALADETSKSGVESTTVEEAFKAYKITPDSSPSLDPSLTAIDHSDLIKVLAKKNGGLWLGEHHNSESDHKLQAGFIRKIHSERTTASGSKPMAIGLEQVQKQFQGALDDFVSGKTSLNELKKQVDWEKRWVWSFDVYIPIFTVARELKIPLLALNVDSEDLIEVEKGGLPGLPRSRMNKYITDPAGFAQFAQPNEFKTYVNYVIKPSYDLHERMGLLFYTMSGEKLDERMTFRNFFSGRILWDESMASTASAWTSANPDGLMIGLVGADHVKFKNGIPGRYARMAGATSECTSIILNPTLIDTRPSGSVSNVADADSNEYPDRLTLQLRYLKEGVDVQSPDSRSPSSTGGVLPFSDYIVVG